MDDTAKHRIWLSDGQWTIQHPVDCNIDRCAVRALAERDDAMRRLYRSEAQRAEQAEVVRHSTQRIHLERP